MKIPSIFPVTLISRFHSREWTVEIELRCETCGESFGRCDRFRQITPIDTEGAWFQQAKRIAKYIHQIATMIREKEFWRIECPNCGVFQNYMSDTIPCTRWVKECHALIRSSARSWLSDNDNEGLDMGTRGQVQVYPMILAMFDHGRVMYACRVNPYKKQELVSVGYILNGLRKRRVSLFSPRS